MAALHYKRERFLYGEKENMVPHINNRLLFDLVDTVLVERLFKRVSPEREKALILAVLSDAIEHFKKYDLAEDEKGKRLFQEAEDWILEKNSDWFFSFENICENLGLDPGPIRQQLLCWKNSNRVKRSPH